MQDHVKGIPRFGNLHLGDGLDSPRLLSGTTCAEKSRVGSQRSRNTRCLGHSRHQRSRKTRCLGHSRHLGTSHLNRSTLDRRREWQCFKESWRTRVPSKVKVFLWQLIRGRLPSSEQIAKRHGPSDGRCALCSGIEDCNHIFFSCPIARLMWAGVRELLHCDWNPAGPGEFIAIAQAYMAPFIR
jgi:hypothetical protein